MQLFERMILSNFIICFLRILFPDFLLPSTNPSVQEDDDEKTAVCPCAVLNQKSVNKLTDLVNLHLFPFHQAPRQFCFHLVRNWPRGSRRTRQNYNYTEKFAYLVGEQTETTLPGWLTMSATHCSNLISGDQFWEHALLSESKWVPINCQLHNQTNNLVLVFSLLRHYKDKI